MGNTNGLTRERFIKDLGHLRKVELANSIMDGSSMAELNALGFSKITVQEMASKIKLNVIGFENLKVALILSPEEVDARNAQIARANSDAEKKSLNQASAPDQTVGNTEPEVPVLTTTEPAQMGPSDEADES